MKQLFLNACYICKLSALLFSISGIFPHMSSMFPNLPVPEALLNQRYMFRAPPLERLTHWSWGRNLCL